MKRKIQLLIMCVVIGAAAVQYAAASCHLKEDGTCANGGDGSTDCGYIGDDGRVHKGHCTPTAGGFCVCVS